jgi:hypothetical protein
MNIIDRAKNILLTPKTEWAAIAAEEPSVPQILTGYVIPLALIPVVGHVIGLGVIGQGAMASMTWGVAMAVITFVSAIVGLYITSYIVDFLAPNFGSQKNFGRAVQLVAYSYTPSWVAGIFYIIPALGILALLAGLYGLYLLYLGLPQIMKTPDDKVVIYLVVTIVAVIIVSFILTAILTAVVFGIFGLSALSMMGS